ncbi:MAG: hypothetical protein M1828_000930 [Chrysothrix sp. TS-e1954]|nr:MAG: hypothetical protein M1828_000930 [Chrysothrix sp. TS-e1954]
MYNTQGPSGQFGAPPHRGGFPGQGSAPGMGASGFGGPPGSFAPGMGPPPHSSPAPGMYNAQSPQSGRFPPDFQRPANMPNIDFSAPVIRMGTTGPGAPDPQQDDRGGRGSNREPLGNRRMGLGFDNRGDQRNQMRDAMPPLAPPSREEISRTIFVGNITEGVGGDEGIQRILGCAGGLRRWTRVMDADNKPCTFGFAEYEDADSLATASTVLEDVDVPTKRPTGGDAEMNGEGPSKTKLLVVMDENSQKYIDDWRGKGSLKSPEEAQFRAESAREELDQILTALSRGNVQDPNDYGNVVPNGDAIMQDAPTQTKMDEVTGEVVTIPITVEDELSDIPADMRELVGKEIAAFRDRSLRKDLERLRKQEELEQTERRNYANSSLMTNGSPASSVAGGANNIPVGPRDRSVQGAPLGPRSQLPRDYQKGVAFVNGHANGNMTSGTSITGLDPAAEESDASDDELERRRQERKQADLDRSYLEQERRWLARETTRNAAFEREKTREKREEDAAQARKDQVAERLQQWDDNVEAERKQEEYYADRSQWLRNRAAFRSMEMARDAKDREIEDRQHRREQERKNREAGVAADDFLADQAEEIDLQARQRETAQPFKMSLGGAAMQRAQQATAPPRRTTAEVEGLLEDEDETSADGTKKRPFVPLQFDELSAGARLTEEERSQAVRNLAAEIPSDKEGLWNWNVPWNNVEESVVQEQLRPFVEKKIVEYLGIQEDFLVDSVVQHIKRHGGARELVESLQEVLDEEAEPLVRKLWRMIIFYGESERRGLGTT